MISDREKQAMECLELAAQADDPAVQKSLRQAADALLFNNLTEPSALTPGSSGHRQTQAD